MEQAETTFYGNGQSKRIGEEWRVFVSPIISKWRVSPLLSATH